MIIFKPNIGICMYVAYFFLVPILKIQFNEFSVGNKFIGILIFITSIIKYNRNFKWDVIRPFIPFLFLIISSFAIFPLSDGVSYDYSLGALWGYLIDLFVVPFSLYIYLKCEPQLYHRIQITMLIVIAIIVLYGVFLLTTSGINPYILIMTDIFDDLKDISYYYQDTISGRMFGRTSSVFHHPMTFGFVLGMIAIYLTYMRMRGELHNMVYVILLSITVACILTCGVRTSLATLGVAFMAYLILSHRIKFMFKACFILFISYILLIQIPWVSDYIDSIFHQENAKVEGSSMEMRLEQLQGCLDEIRYNPLFGKGLDWHSYYNATNGNHPVILAFESLIFVILCDTGFVGLLIWVVFAMMYCSYNKNINLLTIFVYFITYLTVTGMFGVNYFMIFYTLFLYGENYRKVEIK